MLASKKNRLHKTLTDAGIRPGVMVSDVHGKTAGAMIEALIDGHTLLKVLTLANPSELLRSRHVVEALIIVPADYLRIGTRHIIAL